MLSNAFESAHEQHFLNDTKNLWCGGASSRCQVKISLCPHNLSQTQREIMPRLSFTRKVAVPSTNIQGDDSSQFPTMRRNVSFGDQLEILEFPIVLGDSVCSSGAPVQIGWKPSKIVTRNLEVHELCREQSSGGRRSKRELLLSVHKRALILLNAGFDENEIETATEDAKVIRQHRRESRYQWKPSSCHWTTSTTTTKQVKHKALSLLFCCFPWNGAYLEVSPSSYQQYYLLACVTKMAMPLRCIETSRPAKRFAPDFSPIAMYHCKFAIKLDRLTCCRELTVGIWYVKCNH